MPSRLAGWLLVGMLFPAVLAAQQPDLLLGRIVAEGGAPLMGARVEALSVSTELTRSGITDRNGRYLITFPDGGGIYVLRVTMLGMSEEIRPLIREGAEELLVADFMMYPQAIDLDEIIVSVLGSTGEAQPAGEESVVLSQDLLNRLPLDD